MTIRYKGSTSQRLSGWAAVCRILLIVAAILIFIALSTGYLLTARNNARQDAENEAIILAQSLEAMVHPEHIAALSGTDDDLARSDYLMIKNNLIHLVQTTNQIRFAYLLGQRDGGLVILADSEPAGSPDYAPPGTVYEKTDPIVLEPFQTGQSVLTPPLTDHRGSWINALVPIRHPGGDQITALFVIRFSAAEWQAQLERKLLPDFIIVAFMLVFLMVLIYIWKQKSSLKTMSQILTYDEALYRNMFSQAPIGVALINDHHFVEKTIHGHPGINPAGEKILGRSTAELSEITWSEITHPDDLPADLDLFRQFKAGEIDDYTLEKRFIRPDGASIWTDIHVSNLRDLPDHQNLHLFLMEDITSFKRGEQQLIESERSKSVLLSNLPGMAYRCNYDKDWTMQFVSDGCLELTGYRAEQLIGNRDLSFNDVIKSAHRDTLFQEWQTAVEQQKPLRQEYEIITASGESKWVYELGEAIYTRDGQVEALEGIILDITERKAAEEQLRFSAEHDPWTGLFNRQHLEQIISHDAGLLQTGKRAVIGINLSSMYTLSLTYGFSYSQSILTTITENLSRYSSASRLLFSSYEYRFIYYVKDYRNRDELMSFSQTIAGAISPILANERISGGIGVLEITDSGPSDIETILKNVLLAAELAMKNDESDLCVQFFDQVLADQIQREEHLERELLEISNGMDDDRLYLLYQPILDLNTDQICGFEALARLNSTHDGLVPPNEFIPIAEKSRLIIQLGDVIIRKALQFLKKLQARGLDQISVSINISAIQLLRDDFTTSLIEQINRLRINPANVGLELTESIFTANYDEINRITRELRDLGMRILIDDFGTGYSSLAREREINADVLKIDKHFIDKLLDVSPDAAITSDIIAMGHKLGHRVVAEGVEYNAQLQYLKAHNCDLIQGYLISRPLKEDLAIERLKQYDKKLTTQQTDVYGDQNE